MERSSAKKMNKNLRSQKYFSDCLQPLSDYIKQHFINTDNNNGESNSGVSIGALSRSTFNSNISNISFLKNINLAD